LARENVNFITGSGTLTLNGPIKYTGTAATIPAFASLIFFNNFILNINDVKDSTQPFYSAMEGPFLSIMHHFNYCLKNNLFNNFGSLEQQLFWGIQEGIDNTNPNNYFRFLPSASTLPQYEDNNIPFLIERGDEIRTTYTSGSVTITQDFSVTDVGFTDYASGSVDNTFRCFNNFASPFTGSFQFIGASNSTRYSTGSQAIRQYNKIFVYPDPSTLTIPIPSGSVKQYTVRRRKNADNTVNAISSPLEGTNGAETYSGGGYIIPNDLTVTQKRNVQTLITQLKAKNNFRNDDNG